MAVISDKRILSNSGTYEADVVSASDYTPFGMPMVGRTFSSGSYRYGFNGKENDNEVKGEGNQQDYGFRIYDPRLGRFLSFDPLSKDYPYYTPYQFAGNSPVGAIDLDGLEPEAFSIMRATRANREEKARLAKIDPKLAQEYESKGNLTGLTYVGGALTLGWGANVAATMGFRPLLTNMFKAGAMGAGVNGLISYSKGDNGYEIVKATTSGFFSGAVLGIGWGNSVVGSIAGGSLSGSIGEIVNQEFDNKFGGQKGYNLERIAVSGGIGAVANVLSSSILSKVNQTINTSLKKAMDQTTTSGYRRIIKNAILESSPRIGQRQLNVAINQQIKSVQAGLIKQASAIKAAVTQAIERNIDYASDKFNDSVNKK